MFAMQGAAQGSVCPQCGSTEMGSFFCKNCGATLRQAVPLVPTELADSSHPSVGFWKQILRGTVKTTAAVAAIVSIFDNRATGVAGIVLVASVALFLLCLLIWRVLSLGDDEWFWPKKSD
jgi:hypothetical protein